MRPYIKRTTQITVLPDGEAIFSESATQITIVDEAGGEFVQIEQTNDFSEKGKVSFNPNEWLAISDAVNQLFLEIEEYEAKTKRD